jgi:hypothetical protein
VTPRIDKLGQFVDSYDLTAAEPVAPGHSNSPRWQLIDNDAIRKNISKA